MKVFELIKYLQDEVRKNPRYQYHKVGHTIITGRDGEEEFVEIDNIREGYNNTRDYWNSCFEDNSEKNDSIELS